MKKTELVIIPSPGLSHLTSTVEAAKLLLQRDHRLSITFLIMKFPNDDFVNTYTQKISSDPNSTTSSLRIINLPEQDIAASGTFLFDIVDSQVPNVRQVLSELVQQSSAQVGGIIVDMFCTKFADVADEFGLPCYIFFTSSASAFGLFSHIISLKFEHNQELTQYNYSDAELSVPCVSIKVPAKVLPAVLVTEGPLTEAVFDCLKRIPRMKGVLINTFYELESYAIQSLSNGKSPKAYPVGPMLNLTHQVGRSKSQSDDDEIKNWLDLQPESSVVFLCFGSRGSFEVPQLKEIASALERSGHRFLWSVRKPPPIGMGRLPTDYEDLDDILPEGFLERTKGRGKLIGWAPQMEVLSHPAVGGFVSHCGWNSTLESVWCGVPVATFPLYAEQQLNAFQLVKEFGMAEAIRVDYRKDSEAEVVGSEEIEAAIRRLMVVDGSSTGVREKVRKMQKESRLALEEGGSSYNAQISFIEDVINNLG